MFLFLSYCLQGLLCSPAVNCGALMQCWNKGRESWLKVFGKTLVQYCGSAVTGYEVIFSMHYKQVEARLTMWGGVLGAGLGAWPGWPSPTLCASLRAAICCSAAWVCSWRRWACPACSPRALSNTLTALSFSFSSSICTQTCRQVEKQTC